MSHRRISSTALTLACRDMRSARPALVEGGRYNVGAIMRAATMIARFQIKGLGTWRVRMAFALREVWAKAKKAMAAAQAAASASQPAPAPRTALAHVARRPARSYGWDRGVRAVVNGW